MTKITKKTGITTNIGTIIILIAFIFSIGMSWSTVWGVKANVEAQEEMILENREEIIELNNQYSIVITHTEWIMKTLKEMKENNKFNNK